MSPAHLAVMFSRLSVERAQHADENCLKMVQSHYENL